MRANILSLNLFKNISFVLNLPVWGSLAGILCGKDVYGRNLGSEIGESISSRFFKFNLCNKRDRLRGAGV